MTTIRAINPKINAPGGVFRGGGAVGPGMVGSAVFGRVGAGVKAPLPGVIAARFIAPWGVGVACHSCRGGGVVVLGEDPCGRPGVEYGCEDRRGVLWGAEMAAPEPLPIGTVGVLCPALIDGAEGIDPGTFSASAIAPASASALGKRAIGSFARQRIMTVANAGGTFELMSVGKGGVT